VVLTWVRWHGDRRRFRTARRSGASRSPPCPVTFRGQGSTESEKWEVPFHAGSFRITWNRLPWCLDAPRGRLCFHQGADGVTGAASPGMGREPFGMARVPARLARHGAGGSGRRESPCRGKQISCDTGVTGAISRSSGQPEKRGAVRQGFVPYSCPGTGRGQKRPKD
jgi:hypothetical protein